MPEPHRRQRLLQCHFPFAVPFRPPYQSVQLAAPERIQSCVPAHCDTFSLLITPRRQSRPIRRSIPDAILNRSFTASGTLDIVAKDVALAGELAKRLGAPANTGGVANLIYQAAQDAGLGQEGYPAVARVLEFMAGVELGDGE